jgi:hypothetical protein
MTVSPLRADWTPYCPAYYQADTDTNGSKLLIFPEYYILLGEKDLDHILTILGRTLTDMARMRPQVGKYRRDMCAV